MKKKSGSRIGNLFKTIFNVRAWSDYDRIRAFTLYLGNGIKFLFVPQKKESASNEALANFKEAMDAQNLTEADILARQRGLYRLSILMCVIAFGFFCYAMYHLFYGGIFAVIISLVLMLVALVLAFRYHFWYYQIRERKLGCTFREWYSQGFLGKKS
ncbi:intracellular multiplication protein IcmV [Legionella beliardensis]|uniref:Intracellular multiplication protein IcmV n=1 Tax=Legionella beliardensis TaxID=91822 RepID=A0A378I565_9GAMM|nr:type IVB secretion system protein IcmV [Legionella beliardensis]STX29846.1 intracellular multiplication protein IcmV [Legionella beliardensis]